MKRRIAFILCIVILQINVSAELPFFERIQNARIESNDSVEWVNFGPGMSGYCEEFWCHPSDTNVMFMGPDMHVSYGTWDNGNSWHTIKDSDGNGLDMRRVHDIEFSLLDPDYGIAIEREGEVFQTTDRGKTWNVLFDIGKAHTKIAIHPTNDSIWFIGAGDFWNVKANHRTLAKPNGIKQNRANYGYVWKTTDRGATWTKVASGISANLDVGRIIFNPNFPDSILMASSHGMFISPDGGNNWAESNSGLPNNLPRDLTSFYNAETGEFVLYAVEQTVYVPDGSTTNTKGGIFKSTDGGLTWTSISGNLGIDLTVITDYWARDRYHRTISNWLGISKSASKATYTTYPTNTFPVYNRIVVNPLDKNEIYISHNKKHDRGFGPGDVWKTEDGGNTWFACARNGSYWIDGENKSYWEGKNNPTGANIDFAHLQVYMNEGSEGSGTRMMEINSIGQVFIGIDQQTLRSNNHGESWHQVDDFETAPGSDKWLGRGGSDLPGRYMLHETGIPDRRLFCSGEHGLWQTADLGDSPDKDAVALEQIEGQVHDHSGNHGAHSISTVAVHPDDPDIIYLLSWRQEHRGKFRRSTDGGKTWINIATIFDAGNNSWENVAPQYSLTIDPENPDNIYFCSIYKAISEVGGGTGPDLTLGEYGVYRSNDGGYTWKVSNSDFPAGASVHRITMDTDNPKVIYAALNQFGKNDPGGLYKSIDGAVSWTRANIPSEITSVNHIFIDRNSGHMYISCGSRSGTGDAGGVWRSVDNGESWEKIFNAPYVWQTEVSPLNPNIILISVPAQIPSMSDNFKNPGVYLSRDAGVNWIKINRGLGQPDKIVDVKPDPYNESILWCAGWGSGWFKAMIQTDSVKAVCNDTDVYENEELTLYGIGSIGAQLTFKWKAPDGISLSSSNKYKTTFVAPEVEKDTNLIITLVVRNSIGADSLDITINVKNYALDSIVVSPSSLDLIKNSDYQLYAIVYPLDLPEGAVDESINWICNDSTIATVSDSGLVKTFAEGNTYVIAFNEASGLNDTCWLSVSSVNGVKGIGKETIQLYPVPVTEGQLRIAGNEDHAKYSVYNLQGITMDSGVLDQGLLDVSHLNPGIYFINISTGKGSTVLKFVISKSVIDS